MHRLFTTALRLIMTLTACVSLTGTASAVDKLIVLGDSISKHGPAVEKLGWSGNWGMAASSEDKDYVHLFLAKLAAAQGGKAPELIIFAEGGGTVTGKATVTDKIRAVGADLAVIQLGENDKDPTEASFKVPYESLIVALKAGNPNARVLCFSTWGPPSGNAVKDAMIRDLCQKYGATFVNLATANRDPLNMAGAEKRFTHNGVNWHPGDKGMQAYADTLWQAYTDPATAAAVDAAAVASTTKITPQVVATEKWDGLSNFKWTPAVVSEELDGKKVVKITSTDADKGVIYRTDFDPEKFKKHTLVLTTRIKGENISEKPKSWNGVKLMLLLQNAEAVMDYPQAPTSVGTFGWTEVKWRWRVPDNIVSAKLAIGLEKVTGTVWVDSIELSVEP